MKVTVQRHRLTEGLRPSHWILGRFTTPTPHRHIAKGLFTEVAFTQYIMSNYEKNTKHTKWQETQSEDTEQTSDSDRAGMFEFSDHEIKNNL